MSECDYKCSGENIPKNKNTFDFDYYRCYNPDVAAVFGSDFEGLWYHWCNYGYNECRIHRFVAPGDYCYVGCPPCKYVLKKVYEKFPDTTPDPCPPKRDCVPEPYCPSDC